ncbi:MAG: metal ABC transporter permease [Bdellovibrionales bacterium]|nr:metal ABC transporter permease [Bdellovibrionales bacterium]
MLELLAIYKYTILAGAVLAPALALLGCQLAARDRAVQTLCVAQGATLGVLFGIGVLHYSNVPESSVHYSTILSGFLVSILTFYAGNRLVSHRLSSRNSYYTALFVTLLAAASLVSAIFPALETHLAQVFFGDLATLTDRDSAISFAVGCLALVWLVRSWRTMVDDSFSLMILRLPRSERCFNLLSLLLLCFSVQFVGFLFTAACLFVPTTMLGLARSIRLREHLALSAVLASLSVGIGFAFSLWQTHLPTVPTIVFVLALFSVLVAAVRGR